MRRPAGIWAAFLLCAAALCCFAANSILCRLALRGGEIDAATFTAVRLVSGALLLTALMFLGRIRSAWWKAGDWISGAMLWLYAAAFSFAYLGLSAGTGALLLFGSVQATMIGVGLVRSDHPKALEWAGLLLGFGGLVWLVLPGIAAPPFLSAVLMVIAGAAWGVYSLRGKRTPAPGAVSDDPVATTAGNFLRSAPMGLALALALLSRAHASTAGLVLAGVSGAVTSGLGYVAWYAAIRHLSATRSAIVQLSVPVLAAVGGVAFLGESVTQRLVIASVVVLGGVGLALTVKSAR